MKIARRQVLRWAAGAAFLPSLSQVARSQAYPARPVRLIVGLAAGGSVDNVTRLMAQWLSVRLGQQVIVENRPGAAGNIATEVVARATPDGYTLLVVLAGNAINASLLPKNGVNLVRDIVPVAGLVRVPNLMVVYPGVPAQTVPEFIAYAKANPKKLSFASSGNGSSLHVVGELFKMMAGVEMLHVAYRGGAPALVDVMTGRVQVIFDTIPESIEYIRASKLRALAVTTANRSDSLPDVPPMRDFVPGFEAGSWWGVGAPKGTPAEMVDQLNAAINAGLADPELRQRLAELGTTPLRLTPPEFGTFVEAETNKWARVIEFSGVKQW